MTRSEHHLPLKGARISRRDTTARLGGDEFAVLCQDAKGSSPPRSGSPGPAFGTRGRVFSCARRCTAGLRGDGFDERCSPSWGPPAARPACGSGTGGGPPAWGELLLDGERIALTPLEYAVMSHLHAKCGKVVTRVAILRDVWGYGYEGGSNVVDSVIRSIRKGL